MRHWNVYSAFVPGLWRICKHTDKRNSGPCFNNCFSITISNWMEISFHSNLESSHGMTPHQKFRLKIVAEGSWLIRSLSILIRAFEALLPGHQSVFIWYHNIQSGGFVTSFYRLKDPWEVCPCTSFETWSIGVSKSCESYWQWLDN